MKKQQPTDELVRMMALLEALNFASAMCHEAINAAFEEQPVNRLPIAPTNFGKKTLQ